MAALLQAGCSAVPRSRFPTGDAALERMHATYECSRGVGGEAKLDYFGEEGRVRGDLLYLAVLPEQLRMDVYSPFGAILSTLTTDGTDFSLYDLEHATMLHGPASACNVARFTRVPVPPFALVQLLRGESPVLVHTPETIRVRWKHPLFHAGFYRLTIESHHDASQQIDLLPLAADLDKPWSEQRVKVLRVVVRQHGRVLYSVELRGHRPGRTDDPFVDPDGLSPNVPPSGPPCDAPLPDRVRFVVPDSGQELIFDNAKIGEDVVHNGVKKTTPQRETRSLEML